MGSRGPALVALMLGVALTAPTCLNHHLTEVAAHGTEIRHVRGHEPPARHKGMVVGRGDFVLESPAMRVVVGGVHRRVRQRGAVLEAMVPEGPLYEGIGLVAPRLHVAGGSFPVIVGKIYAIWSGSRPKLCVEGSVRVGRQRLHVLQEFELNRSEPILVARTRVTAGGKSALRRVSVGARIDWGGADPFVPGTGTQNDSAWREADFVATSGRVTSTLLGFRKSGLRTSAAFDRRGQSAFLSHTDVVSRRQSRPEQRQLEDQSFLIVTRGGLGEAVRRLGWARGEPFREALATLPYMPAGAEVTILDEDEAPFVSARPNAEGKTVIPLPVSRAQELDRPYFAVATAYGHAPSDPVPLPDLPKIRLTLEIPEGGQIRIRAFDHATGLPLAARVRVAGMPGTPTPNLGPKYTADGAQNAIITLQGETVVPVEPGQYRVLVSHGPEWSLVDEVVEVTKTFRPDVEARLEHVVRMQGWIPCDFHVHAAPSYDSQVSLRDRVASLHAEGIRFAVPTDHNHVTDYAPAVQALNLPDFGTVPGVEITTWEPNFGHFNAFPFPRDASLPAGGAPPYEGITATELFSGLRALDPLMAIQVNHPRMEPNIGYFDLMGFDPDTGTASGPYSDNYDLIEVWNGYDLARPFNFERLFQEWLTILRRGRRVVATGSSDSHNVVYEWAGYPRTYVWVQGGQPHDGTAVVQALKAGRAMVTSGPMLQATIDGLGPGETAMVPPGDLSVHVHVQAPSWMEMSSIEIYTNNEDDVLMHEIPEPERVQGLPLTLRFNEHLTVPMSEDGFVVVMARGTEPMDRFFGRAGVFPIAFTNPIWVRLQDEAEATAVAGAPSLEHERPPDSALEHEHEHEHEHEQQEQQEQTAPAVQP